MKGVKNINVTYYSDLLQVDKKLVEEEIQCIVKKALTKVDITHNIELIHILSKTYGYKPEILLVHSDGALVGFIPFLILHNKAISLPHFSY